MPFLFFRFFNDLRDSLRTADAFSVVASLPPKGREATTGNASAVRGLFKRRTILFLRVVGLCNYRKNHAPEK